MYPDWVTKHRKPGTNISKIGDKYYLYEVTSVWDKEKKRAKKITKQYLGRITEDGFVPKKEKAASLPLVPPAVKNYGGTVLAENLGAEILQRLREFFPELAEMIFAISILRLLYNHPFKRLESEYKHSFLSEMFGALDLSGRNLTAFLRVLGDSRDRIVAFMKSFMAEGGHILFDGTSIISKSEKLEINNVGYNAHRQYDPQVNLLYAFSSTGQIPVYYRVVAGNIRDVTALTLCIKESGIKDITVIMDKGCGSKANFEALESAGLSYIAPLRRNSEPYSKTKFESGNKADLDGHFLFNSRPIWYYVENDVCFYLDSELKTQEEKDYCLRMERNPDEYTKEGFLEKQFKFGTIALKTNLSLPADQIYFMYKERAQIEQTFDFLKNLLEQDKSYMQSQNSMEGWAFLNHISLMLCYQIYNLLRQKNLLSMFSVEDLISHLKYIHKIKIPDGWLSSEISKKTLAFLDQLDLHVT